ncbi:hypothetical protein ACA910_006505 [Epithemia clementina (nom. ined.)]
MLLSTWNFVWLLSCILLHKVHAADISVAWVYPGLYAALPYENAIVGDTITFLFATGEHNVYIHPSQSCDPTNHVLVGTEGGANYTFTDADIGRVVFVCEVEGHCQEDAGQILTVLVTSNSTANTPAQPSASAPPPAPSPTARSPLAPVSPTFSSTHAQPPSQTAPSPLAPVSPTFSSTHAQPPSPQGTGIGDEQGTSSSTSSGAVTIGMLETNTISRIMTTTLWSLFVLAAAAA